MKLSRFAWLAWATLAVSLLVIVWGDVVQATGSGDGCGAHWPTCNGEVLPLAPSTATFIEFFHRVTSGLVFLMSVGLFVAARRLYPAGSPVRLAAGWSLIFMVIESLLGAALVLFRLVGEDVSLARAIIAPIHLVNTLLLIGWLTLTAWWASGGAPIRLQNQGAVGWALGLGAVGLLFLAASGAVTSLGDTLFPVQDTNQAFERSASPGAHFLERLRILHPYIAVSLGLYLIAAASLVAQWRPNPLTQRLARFFPILFVVQLAMGAANVLAKASLATQLPHLLLSDLVWMGWVMLSLTALATGQSLPTATVPAPKPNPHAGNGRAQWQDYFWLTKPRVISLLLFTTLLAMLIAAGGWPGLGLFVAVAIGGYLSAGAANALNMVIDRDIDGRMGRTSKRPTVTNRISSRSALIFAFAIKAISFVLLWQAANLLTALLSLAGLLWYVFIYTLYMKRRYWNNIVIGGAAGAFPPLVGWAAVTGDLNLFAWYLFAIIFFWTPVHFWALALMIKDDYAKVGVPMLPVVMGDRVTVAQIGLYAILTVVLTLIPFAMGEVRLVYLITSLLLNGLLLLRSLELYREISRPKAVRLYKYSMAYLALLFVAMAVDRSLWM